MAESSSATQPDAIRKIERRDHADVVSLLARAFDDDPLINFIVPQDASRERRIRAFMEMGLRRLTFPYGETYVTTAGDGVALWNPPGGRPHGLLSDLALLPGMIGATGLRGLPRAMSAFSLAEKMHPHEPHYYLLAIGVDPARQGKGVGSSLLAPMVERCDRERVGAYLESSKERNVPLYERFGFKVRSVVEIPGGGPRIWPMWRDPR